MIGTIECEAMAERDARFVEIVAMIGGDDDDGFTVELVAFECCQNLGNAVVELAGASVVERADLVDLCGRQGFPFGFEVGAADELVDIEVDTVAVGSSISGVGEHADIRFGAAVRQVVAGKEHMPEKWFALGCHAFEPLLDALGDDLWCHELGE